MSLRQSLSRSIRGFWALRHCAKYHRFTMAPASVYWRNMLIVNRRRHVQGCVVECGVWRGGMSAGMAEVLGPGRDYFLFDSFEGLPPATELDGPDAAKWQEDTSSTTYFDNCSAPIEFAELAMKRSGAIRFNLVKGWFKDTLPCFRPPSQIAVLRVDGDWYDSTLTVLETLVPHLAPGAVVILDDYYAWDGCSRAVHEFLARHQSTARLTQELGICLLVPREAPAIQETTIA